MDIVEEEESIGTAFGGRDTCAQSVKQPPSSTGKQPGNQRLKFLHPLMAGRRGPTIAAGRPRSSASRVNSALPYASLSLVLANTLQKSNLQASTRDITASLQATILSLIGMVLAKDRRDLTQDSSRLLHPFRFHSSCSVGRP